MSLDKGKITKAAVIFLLAHLVLFWLNYSASPPGIAIQLLLGIAVIFVVAIGPLFKKAETSDLVIFIIACVTLAANDLMVYYFFQKQLVYVDNQNPVKITLFVDGEEDIDVNAYKYETFELRPGKHRIKTKKFGKDSLLEEFEVEVEMRNTYFYNVMNSCEYLTGEKHYSDRNPLFDRDEVPENYEEGLRERWFVANYSFILQDAPSSVTIRKNVTDFSTAEASRSYIVRKNRRKLFGY